jgi:hypothetical protein
MNFMPLASASEQEWIDPEVTEYTRLSVHAP